MTTEEQNQRQTAQAVNVGLVANAVLAAMKTVIGVVGHSPALLADGINSTSDVAYYVVVKVFMHLARKPADSEHPYGHSQLESIAAVVVGSFVITTAIAIFWDAVNSVYDLWVGTGQFGGARAAALWVALFTIGLKIVLTAYTRRVGRQSGNAAVWAMAYDHRNDVVSASGAALGIFFGRHGYPWVDPMVGALVALVVLRTGVVILRESSANLMDTVPGDMLDRSVRQVAAGIRGVNTVEEIQAHRFGPYVVINIQIGIDGAATVAEGDRIASQVEQEVHRHDSMIRRVYVHYHPDRTGSAPRS